MASNEVTNADVTAIRAVIRAFLDERLQAKLEKLKEQDGEKAQALRLDYAPENWIPDAAKRVGQIQQVSHAQKFTHPSADGSNLFSVGNPHAAALEIGSHSLNAEAGKADVVGNAAALDVYKFLSLQVNGTTLLARALAGDPALLAALPADCAATAMAAFASLPEAKGEVASHTLAKQLYWPVAAGEYHLLAPLFPSRLVHQVHGILRDHKFSEATKAAREAKAKDDVDSEGYYDYPNLLIQHFGGTKPQNISQLNSERGGENWLLPNCPPKWERQATLQPPKILQTNSIFTRHIFGWQRRVREITHELRDFLAAQADKKSVLWMRERRQRLIAELVDEVLYFASRVQTTFPPGWTRGTGAAHEKLELHPAQQYWLDPYRASPEFDDPEFAAGRCREDWQSTVCEQFAAWVNKNIEVKNKTDMGDPEHVEWQRELRRELRLLRENLDVV